MKVTVFHTRFDLVGGVEVLASLQAELMRREGHEVDVVTYLYDPALWGERLAGVPVHAQGVVGPAGRRRPGALWDRRDWSDAFFRSCRAEAVVAHSYPTTVRLAGSSYQKQKIWYCHEPPRDLHLAFAWPALTSHLRHHEPTRRSDLDVRHRLRAVEQWATSLLHPGRRHDDVRAAQKMEKIWANSEFTREVCRQVYGRYDVEVLSPMVRFPTHVARKTGLRRREGLQVLAQSRLNVEKNFGNLLTGFATFADRTSPRPHLHVVGTGPRLPGLRRLTRRLRLQDAVTFYGYLPDAERARIYDRCDVFALFPVDEPFGMVFPEAMAHGLLVLGPDHGGPREILDEGRLGICVDVFAPSAIASAFERVWCMPDVEVDELRRKAERACRQRYEVASLAPRLQQLLVS